MTRLLGALLIILIVAGCGGTTDEPEAQAPEVVCSTPDPVVVSSIEQGLTMSGAGSLTGAKSLDVPPEFQNSAGWPEIFVAADIDGPGMEGSDEIAVWATSDGYGPIWAIDEMAREFSDWGTGAQPGSEAREAQDLLRSSEAYDDVRDCADG